VADQRGHDPAAGSRPVSPDLLRGPLLLPPNPVHRAYRGGDALRRFRGVPERGADQWPEEWIGSMTLAGNPDPDGRPQGMSTVTIPGHGSMRLADLVAAAPEAMVGAASAHRFGSTTGVLVKMIALSDRAPLHAHPDAAFAKRELGSPVGKAEAWVIVEAPGDGLEPPHAGMGIVPGVTRAAFRDAIDRRAGEALRAMVHRTPIHPGEAWVLSPRVPHLLGPGIFFIELQEPSDLAVLPEGWTLGADEAGSTMGLGWDRALEAIDLEPVARGDAVRAARQEPVMIAHHGASVVTQLIGPEAGGWFEAERLDVADEVEIGPGRFSVDIVLSGRGTARGEWGVTPVGAGDTLAWPAQVGHRYASGTAPLAVIRCMGPRA